MAILVSTHSPTQITGPKGSYALLTDSPESAVVFVHGFWGDSRKTWHDFQGLVDQTQDKYPAWGKCDLFFFQYESRKQVKPLAEELRAFLNALFTADPAGPERIIALPFQVQPSALPSGRPVNTRPETIRAYKRLILVGHSTGALIIREAILQELRPVIASLHQPVGSQPFVSRALLRFFAPAHRGVICSGTAGVFLHAPPTEWILRLYLHSNPLFMNLQSGSPVVEDVRRETEGLHMQFPKISALIATSLFGSDDAMVTIGKYAHDIDCPTEPRQTHTSVCKPSVNYTRPMEFVINAIT